MNRPAEKKMEKPVSANNSTRLLWIVLAGAAVVVFAAGGAYIAHLNSENAQLRAAAAKPQAPAAAAKAANPAVAPAQLPASARTFTPEQRSAMLARLGGSGVTTTNPVWFATMPNNPEAAAFQHTLQSVFEEAGWQVRGNVPVGFALKPGVFVFSADEEPPDYIGDAIEAIQAAGITVTSGRGYRQFYQDKKKENPNWRGFDLAADQTYVIAIGRKPDESQQ
jgi:hypothetical protein